MFVALLFIRWLFISSALALAAAIVPGVEITGGPLGLLGVAAVFGIINAVIGSMARLVSIPLTVPTFGLFALVVNGVLLALTAGLSQNLAVGGLLQAILAAFVISLVATIAQFVLYGRSAQPA